MALIDTPGMNSDRESDAMTDEKLFVLLVVCVGLPLVFAMLAWHLVKRFGYRCHWCDGRVLDLERLPNQDQRQILQYLEQYHDSNPDPKSIHVCSRCCAVYDDNRVVGRTKGYDHTLRGAFSSYVRAHGACDEQYMLRCSECGELTVRQMGDFVAFPTLKKCREELCADNDALVDKLECLRCGRKPVSGQSCVKCDTQLKIEGCLNCHWLHFWYPIPDGPYRFLVAWPDGPVPAAASNAE